MESKIDHNKKDIWEALGTNHDKLEELAKNFHQNINEITSVSEAITTSVKQVRDQVLGEPGIEVTPYEVELVLLGIAIEKVMAGMSRFHSQHQYELPPEIARIFTDIRSKKGIKGKKIGGRIVVVAPGTYTEKKETKKKSTAKKKTTKPSSKKPRVKKS